jgi:urease accessory protein
VEAAVDGGARLAELRSEVPLVLRRTGLVADPTRPGPADLPTVAVHLVNAAAGPLAGDELRIDVAVGAGVRLVLGSVAATVALPGRGDAPSVLHVTAEVADGGALDVAVEPTVAARGCRHRIETEVMLGAGAFLRWREEIMLGRFGEAAGSVWASLRVDVAAGPGGRRRPLLAQDLDLAPDAPGLHGPAVLGGARAVGSLLVAAPGPAGLGREPAVGDGVALLPLAGPGVLVSALADDAVTLRRRLGAVGRTAPSYGRQAAE